MQQASEKISTGSARWWRAVERRARRYDGGFFYAVRSTGIYCRPSCPARRPARHRVVFFRSAQAAEAQGFRPCPRCLPNAALLPDPARDAVLNGCRYIERHFDEPLTQLAAQLGLSPFALHRAFKRLLGITPREYAAVQRLRRFKAALAKGEDVTTALYQAGYGSSSRLYERAPRWLGMTSEATSSALC